MIENYCERCSCSIYIWATAAKFSPIYEDCSADLAKEVKDLNYKLKTFVGMYNCHSHNEIDGVRKQPDPTLIIDTSSICWKVESAINYTNVQFSNYAYRVHNNEKKICINFSPSGQFSNEFIPIECSFCSNFKKFDVENEILVSHARNALEGK